MFLDDFPFGELPRFVDVKHQRVTFIPLLSDSPPKVTVYEDSKEMKRLKKIERELKKYLKSNYHTLPDGIKWSLESILKGDKK